MFLGNSGTRRAVIAALTGFVGFAVCVRPVLAATLASQSDLGKTWKTGGLKAGTSVSVSGQPFKTAASFTVPRKMARSWDAQAGLSPQAPLRKGDALTATFYIRSARPGGMATFAVEGGPKFERLVWRDLKLSDKWQKVAIPFTSRGS